MRQTALIGRSLCLLLCVLNLLGSSIASADDTYVAGVEESWNNAQRHYAKGQYQSAFSDFYWAAIRDHPQAQQMVGLMYLLGPEAFGPGVKRDRVEADFWMHTAQIHGVDVNEYLRCAITRKVSERNIPIADRALPCLIAGSPDRQTSVSTKATSPPGIDRTRHR